MRTRSSSRSIAFSWLLLSSLAFANAQTYFYINSIGVDPAEPTENDAITISVHGDLSSSGAYIVSADHMLMGSTVHITIVATDPGGLSVLTPHTEQITIGNLPAGPYNILIDGAFILDSAPEFQHSFNVSGGGEGPFCEDLDIVSIQWHPFTDAALIVHVTNTLENSGFSYPGFVLLDAEGDTLARETVIYKGIGTDSWHTLELHEDAVIPEGTFQGTLHLWTGFYEEFACEWGPSIDLCPATECTTIHPYVVNLGNGLAIGTFTWTITADGTLMAQGQFELTAEMQSDQAVTCLPPGAYVMTVEFDQEPTGGQLRSGVDGENAVTGPSQPLLSGTPTPMPINVLERCVEGTNTVLENDGSRVLVVTTMDRAILVSDPTGAPLGTVYLFDAVGRSITTTTTLGDRMRFDVTTDGIYFLRTRDGNAKVIVQQP
ncbi:MAG TPA: hypothetical protein PLB89_10920 [Flavobacteriales bacterium]|nr:hypothetical protein [Flavobacteriales bacterium]